MVMLLMKFPPALIQGVLANGAARRIGLRDAKANVAAKGLVVTIFPGPAPRCNMDGYAS